MDKRVVEIKVPATNNSYEFIIPSKMKVGVAASLIGEALSEHETGIDFDKKALMLCSMVGGNILDNHASIEDAGVKDGHVLLIL